MPKISPLSPTVSHLTTPFLPVTCVADLLAIARGHGLDLTSEQDQFDDTGLDFRVVHARDQAGQDWILRSPRRPEVALASEAEARVLKLLQPALPVAVPDWRVHTRALIAYPKVPGTPAVTVGANGPTWNVIDPQAPAETFLETFARTLAALQAVGPEQAAYAGIRARSIAEVRAELARDMNETRAVLAPPDAVWTRWQRWVQNDAHWPAHVALAHGDLHPGHMLLDAAGRLVGVLDWSEAAVTDPALDLAMFFGCFGEAAFRSFVPRFERAGGRTWPGLFSHAAERWAAFPVHGAAWALRTGHTTALDHARALLASVASEP